MSSYAGALTFCPGTRSSANNCRMHPQLFAQLWAPLVWTSFQCLKYVLGIYAGQPCHWHVCAGQPCHGTRVQLNGRRLYSLWPSADVLMSHLQRRSAKYFPPCRPSSPHALPDPGPACVTMALASFRSSSSISSQSSGSLAERPTSYGMQAKIKCNRAQRGGAARRRRPAVHKIAVCARAAPPRWPQLQVHDTCSVRYSLQLPPNFATPPVPIMHAPCSSCVARPGKHPQERPKTPIQLSRSEHTPTIGNKPQHKSSAAPH